MRHGLRILLLATAACTAGLALASCIAPMIWAWGTKAGAGATRGQVGLQSGRLVVAVFDPSGTQDQTARLKDVFNIGCAGGRLLVQEVGPSTGLMPDGSALRFPAAVTYELSIPGLWLVVLLGAYPGIALAVGRIKTARRKARGECIRCGYDLRADTSDRCPECGGRVGDENRRAEH